MPEVFDQEVDDQITGFIAKYRALRADSGEPILPRKSMTMRDVVSYAPDMTIVELIDDDTWIIRLNGTGHCHHAQLDRTGQNALATCSVDEQNLRRRIAENMFGTPCGLRAQLIQSFKNGESALLESTSLPLIGAEGARLIVTYGLLIQDVAEPYLERPVISRTALGEHRYIDLDYGLPDA